jgi:hypothetical protein
MTKPIVSKIKLRNFQRKIKELGEQELELRAQMKQLYDQFILDVGDSEMALRHVRLAFFQIQKWRVHEQLAERLEFHPFFGASPESSHYYQEFEDEDDDDSLI